MVRMDENAANALKGIKTWVVDSAGYKFENPYVHSNLETIIKLNETIGAEQVYLSSMTINMDYQKLCDELPDGYFPAYDGLIIDL
jgi:phosphoribosyl 1,2-cyclic phosphate phosphodiesterase